MKKLLYFLYLVLFPVLCWGEPVNHNDAGLVGLWHFDDAKTSTYTWDSSGNLNTGTLHGGLYEVGRVTGKYGGALNFDGVNDYVDCGSDASLDITDEITIEAWVKLDVLFSSMIGDFPTHIRKAGSWDCYGYKGGDDKIRFNVIDSLSTIRTLISNDAVVAGTWYHIVGTYDGSIQKLYINGVLQDETEAWSDTIKSKPANSITIGKANQFFEGTIDEVAVYNRALSQGEIWKLSHDEKNVHTNQ